MGIKVGAKSIQSLEELGFVRESRCDEAQGNYSSPPVALEQLAESLRTGIRELFIVSHSPLGVWVAALGHSH
jgi:EAL domain-containing protein (putative c-di-GMP-specific phosphodiesterase class I)